MKILVATDGSRGGSAAVSFAGRLASPGGGTRIRVVQVAVVRRQLVFGVSGAPFPFTALPEIERKEREHATRTLSRAAARLKRPGVRVESAFLVPRDLAPVAETLVREAERMRADLIVVGSEGRGAIRELVLGSVALRLLHRSRRPVTVVRPARARRR
jgi:nucleotide-binding universal stress UspA family protein